MRQRSAEQMPQRQRARVRHRENAHGPAAKGIGHQELHRGVRRRERPHPEDAADRQREPGEGEVTGAAVEHGAESEPEHRERDQVMARIRGREPGQGERADDRARSKAGEEQSVPVRAHVEDLIGVHGQ